MKRVKYKKVRNVQPNYFEYTGIHTSDPVAMQLFVYDDAGYEEYKKVSLPRVEKEIQDELQIEDVKWLNIHGLHDVELIKQVGEMLTIEPFIISDILNVARRSKMEELDQVLFFSIKSILPGEDFNHVHVEQISFLLKDNLLVSFQEKRSDFFTHIRERIKTHSGIVRKKRNDYLLYLLLDAVMENFYVTIEFYEDIIEELVGDIQDEDEPVEGHIIKLTERAYLIESRVSIAEVNQVLDTSFSDEHFDTIGGFVFGLIGEEPQVGNEVEFDNWIFRIEKSEKKNMLIKVCFQEAILKKEESLLVENNILESSES